MRVEILHAWLDQTCGPVSVHPTNKHWLIARCLGTGGFNAPENWVVATITSDGEAKEELDRAAAALALLCESVRQTKGDN